MRLGVLDVGSNTVHLLVVDAYQGARPMPAFSHKTELRLAAHLEDGSSLSGPGEASLRGLVEEALRIAEDKGVEEIIAFATSAVRDAVNGEQVLARIREKTGAQINVMTGHEEARLTFLAARRWFGWSSGRLLVIDIGGGSLEVASGIDEEPDAMQVPAETPDPLAGRSVTEELRRLLACMGALDEERRRLVLLAYYSGFSRDQLAAKFAIPVNTIKTRLRRALIEIRECLGT